MCMLLLTERVQSQNTRRNSLFDTVMMGFPTLIFYVFYYSLWLSWHCINQIESDEITFNHKFIMRILVSCQPREISCICNMNPIWSSMNILRVVPCISRLSICNFARYYIKGRFVRCIRVHLHTYINIQVHLLLTILEIKIDYIIDCRIE